MYSSHSIVYHITAEFYQTLNKNRITMTNFLNLNKHGIFWELPWWCSGKESACQCRRCKRQGFDLWVGKITSRRKWQPIPVFLPKNSHGQRSMVGYSPWGHKVSGTTELLSTLRFNQNGPAKSWPMDFGLCIEWKMNWTIRSPVGLFLVWEQGILVSGQVRLQFLKL